VNSFLEVITGIIFLLVIYFYGKGLYKGIKKYPLRAALLFSSPFLMFGIFYIIDFFQGNLP
jgi:hypothetical protein